MLKSFVKFWKVESILLLDKKLNSYWKGDQEDMLDAERPFEFIYFSKIAPYLFWAGERWEELKSIGQEIDIDCTGMFNRAEFCNFIFKLTIKYGYEILALED